MLFRVFGQLENLGWIVCVVMISADQRHPTARQKWPNCTSVRPISIAGTDAVFFPKVFAQVIWLQPYQVTAERTIKPQRIRRIISCRVQSICRRAGLGFDADKLLPSILVQVVSVDHLHNSRDDSPFPGRVLVPPRPTDNVQPAIAIHINGMNVCAMDGLSRSTNACLYRVSTEGRPAAGTSEPMNMKIGGVTNFRYRLFNDL